MTTKPQNDLSLPDRILLQIIAASDPTWIPDRSPLDHTRHSVLYEKRRDFARAGVVVQNLGGVGASEAARKEASRTIGEMAGDGWLRVLHPRWARTTSFQLLEPGAVLARALAGLPQFARAMLVRLRVAEAHPLARDGEMATHYTLDGPRMIPVVWVPEVVLIDVEPPLYRDGITTVEARHALVQLEEEMLPGLSAGLVVSGTDVHGRAHYALTPAGAALLGEPAEEEDAGPAAEVEPAETARRFYYDCFRVEQARLSTTAPMFAGHLGEIPLAVCALKPRPGAAAAWAARLGEPAPAGG